MRAELDLMQLAVVNRGMAGGDGYRELVKQLSENAEPPSAPETQM